MSVLFEFDIMMIHGTLRSFLVSFSFFWVVGDSCGARWVFAAFLPVSREVLLSSLLFWSNCTRPPATYYLTVFFKFFFFSPKTHVGSVAKNILMQLVTTEYNSCLFESCCLHGIDWVEINIEREGKWHLRPSKKKLQYSTTVYTHMFSRDNI